MFNQQNVEKYLEIKFPDSWTVKSNTGITYDLTENDIYHQVKKVWEIIEELINKYSENTETNPALNASVSNIINQFADWRTELDKLKTEDDSSAANTKNKLISDIKSLIKDINERANQKYNILGYYDSFRIDNIEKNLGQKKADKLIHELEQQIVSVKNLENTVKDIAIKREISKFSEIFHEEAGKYDNFDMQKWYHLFRFRKWGQSQLFLTLGIISILGLLVYLFIGSFEGVFIEVSTGEEGKEEVIDIARTIITMVPRILILSIWIYIISFFFKQYNITQHLAVQNKHRANALDSFDGFLISIGQDHADIKATLALEVAKSIYNQGNTGYLQGGSDNIISPGIVEITKMISNNKP